LQGLRGEQRSRRDCQNQKVETQNKAFEVSTAPFPKENNPYFLDYLKNTGVYDLLLAMIEKLQDSGDLSYRRTLQEGNTTSPADVSWRYLLSNGHHTTFYCNPKVTGASECFYCSVPDF
jgi:hypothetical protein